MAQKTALSSLALPGMIHTFLAKSAAAGIRAFGEAVLTIGRKLTGTVAAETKLQADDNIEPKFDSEFSINE